MTALSYENEQRAGDALMHYLKERGCLAGEGAREEGQKAARNIRAAFEVLEEVTPRPGPDSTPPAFCEAR